MSHVQSITLCAPPTRNFGQFFSLRSVVSVPVRAVISYSFCLRSLRWSGTMASSTNLQLFPSAGPHPLPPRKSSLKKPQPISVPETTTQLRGLALQVTTSPISPPRIQPAPNTFKHSLFCEPPTSPGFERSPPPNLTPRRQPARRLSSRPESLIARSPTTLGENDELPPLPVNTDFGPTTRLMRHPSKRMSRSSIPEPLPTPTSPQSEHHPTENDRLSPLPEKTRFSPPTPKSPEYPATLSQRSTKSLPSRSDSTRKMPLPPASPAKMRSMFPQFDPTKSLYEQSYYPTDHVPAQALPSEKVSKFGSPTERPSYHRFDSAIALVDGYEHIASADDGDVLSIWNASNDHFPVAGRKVRLGLYQPPSQGTSLFIGTSVETPLYSMVKAFPQSPSHKNDTSKHVAIEKHDHSRGGAPVPITQLAITAQQDADSKPSRETTVIFPQSAAIQAVETVSKSPIAAEIATFDPTAASPEAARLAQDAVSEAHRRYACDLARKTRKRDSLGSVIAEYKLEHPTLGTLPITVSKSIKSPVTREPRAKISIHHPSATPAAVAADTLVLAFLDFARDACMLDLPGLLALDSAYVIDTAVSALFAVAAIENSLLHTETVTFAPPAKVTICGSWRQESFG